MTILRAQFQTEIMLKYYSIARKRFHYQTTVDEGMKNTLIMTASNDTHTRIIIGDEKQIYTNHIAQNFWAKT